METLLLSLVVHQHPTEAEGVVVAMVESELVTPVLAGAQTLNAQRRMRMSFPSEDNVQ